MSPSLCVSTDKFDEIHDPPVPIHHEPEPDDPEPDEETKELVRPVKT